MPHTRPCPGSYKDTCMLVGCNGRTLRAMCTTTDTTYADLRQQEGCTFSPGSHKLVPRPEYVHGCKNIKCNGTMLTAQCPRIRDHYVNTTLADGCVRTGDTCPSSIFNRNGQLNSTKE